MLSSFLKKLLFARQFFMIDGKIEVLGKRQVMLPADAVQALQKAGGSGLEKQLKEIARKDMADYARKVGGSEEGMLSNIRAIFETFGLGKLDIVDMDTKGSRCLVRITNPPAESGTITSAVLAGTFSFLFSKDVNAEEKAKNAEAAEYVVK